MADANLTFYIVMLRIAVATWNQFMSSRNHKLYELET